MSYGVSVAGIVSWRVVVDEGWAILLVADWRSRTDGVAESCFSMIGVLDRVVSVEAQGADQPTNAWDLEVLDWHGRDSLGGLGANMTNSADPVALFPRRSSVALDRHVEVLTYRPRHVLRITNAGDSKRGVLALYVVSRFRDPGR